MGDLFAPDTAVNTYGARDRKKLATGKITDKSYVPAGLTAEQYAKIRGADAKKKADNYARNVKKAGVFEDYTEFYKARGTDTNESWSKSVTKGHRMARLSMIGLEVKTILSKLDLLLNQRLLRRRVSLVNKTLYGEDDTFEFKNVLNLDRLCSISYFS